MIGSDGGRYEATYTRTALGWSIRLTWYHPRSSDPNELGPLPISIGEFGSFGFAFTRAGAERKVQRYIRRERRRAVRAAAAITEVIE